MTSMDKVYKKYREMKMNPQKLMDELGIEITDASAADSLGMGIVRKETDLNNEEKQFLLAVERGDIPTARHFLEESQIYFNININCVDPLGRTAILISIENENIEMMELLLIYNVELGDALLHAINEENVEAVEMILANQTTNKKDLSGFLGGVPSSSFTPDITPIKLAAHRDNYEIIKILLDRGDNIAKPHDVRCNCPECIAKVNEDSLNHSRSRINAYRALASPSLMALSSKDPILTAFELSWELKRLSRLENEFKNEYEQLAKQSQDFAVDLLDQTRGSNELELILNYDPNGPVDEDNDRMNLSRLKLAIKYKQKKFVAHPNCQQLLASLWYEGLPGFRRRHIVFKVLLTVSVCLLYPILSLMYMVAPKSPFGLFMRRPFIKFICHSASYMTFLFLLILASQRIESIINFSGEDGGSTKISREVRGAPPTSIEWMILAYVAGLVWAEVKQLWNDGAKTYVQDMWNILDFATNSLYIATFALKLVAYLRVEDEKRNGDPRADLSRGNWDAYDPNLISEGLFAAANIFSSLKLIYIFTVNPQLGPLQISLGRMVMDIMNFLFIAVLVIFSYACGVNQLYWYYAEARTKACNDCLALAVTLDDRSNCECDKTLANLFEILQTLYFAMYGLVDIKHFELDEPHEFTQFVGKLMFGSYSGIMIIVLLNMLIAMLSTSFQIISNDADTEWKYARSKLWMSYFEEGETVPTPFNIIPTPKSMWHILLWIRDALCTCTKKAKRSKWQSIRKLMKRVNERETRYQAVMRDLVKRYIMKRQKAGQTEGVTEDDLNEIKQDISSFRYELLEILRNNGMKTPNASNQRMNNSKTSRNQRRKKIIP
ncbi:hypothetical protein CAPTEDRAFT_172686 [Capitella teleta]|uniref:Transient receptor ion channel domain-containing protein n=1 Tax=Capitella teleta TaxID=283909 RepID=R7T7V4_CAPTE|nr:hypothetical protein CAPTEDRAFT_172686 [Capitella teleta]|eukprot:ELT89523.1 hypothetical protein CAPTEDRAFT_172686 [Capitella teleta]